MGQITKITKETDNKFVNLYSLDTIKKTGEKSRYFVSSRATAEADLKIRTRDDRPDGVMMVMLYGNENKADKLVLIRQYRFPIDTFIYELPAGLVEKGEDYREAAVRETKEETGFDLRLLDVDPSYEKAFYMTVGMTDECVSLVYGYASGDVKDQMLESGEEIEVVLADREEAKRILKEEKLSMPAAMAIMHFIASDKPFDFLNR